MEKTDTNRMIEKMEHCSTFDDADIIRAFQDPCCKKSKKKVVI